MFANGLVRRGAHVAAMLALLVAASSCGNDSTEPEEEEPEVASVRLTIGAQTLTIGTAAGQNVSFTVARGASNVTAVWLKADGTVEPIATTTDFTLKVTPSTSAITYTPSAAQSFTGTLNVSSAVTNAGVDVALFHVAEQHEDFGPITIRITAP